MTDPGVGTRSAALAAERPLGPSSGSAPDAPAGGGGSPIAAEQPESLLRGNLSLRFRRRTGAGEHDADLFGVLGVDLGRPDDAYSAHVLGRVAKDLDGGPSSGSAFDGLDDTRRKSLDAQLYEAWVDYHGDGSGGSARLGRQWLVETPETISLDGVMLQTGGDAVLGGRLGVYGGLPNNEYESSQSGDSMWGAFLEKRPWSGGRVRLDWMHVADEMGPITRRDNLTGVSVWQQLIEPLTVRGRYTWLDSADRERELSATWQDPEADLVIQARYFEQLKTQTDLVNAFDPFSAILLAYQPFRHKQVLVSKGLGENFVVEAGYDRRDLVEESDAGPFNREFQREHLTGTLSDVFLDGLSISLTGENWNGVGSDHNSWGLDLTDRLSDDLRVSLGTYYALFKNDFLLAQERERVRTLYARARYRLDEARSLSLGYEYEDADLDRFDTLTAKMTWHF